MRDPDLTPLGEQQCRDLQAVFPHHDKITHLVASPLRRTIYTCLLTFEPEVQKGFPIVALPELQEISDLPSDTGSSPDKLHDEFDRLGCVDLGLVEEGWDSKQGKFAPTGAEIEGRAREARVFLRDFGIKAAAAGEGEVHIAVVSHGGFLHYFTDDWVGHDKYNGTGWANTEFRSYTFVDETYRDAQASIEETAESTARRQELAKPTEGEMGKLRQSAMKSWSDLGYQSPKL